MGGAGPDLEVVDPADLPRLPGVAAVVSTVPGGAQDWVLGSLDGLFTTSTSPAVVLDAAYLPRLTPILEAAGRHGITAVAGVDMLLAQGYAAFSIWTGVYPPVAEMSAAVRAYYDIVASSSPP